MRFDMDTWSCMIRDIRNGPFVVIDVHSEKSGRYWCGHDTDVSYIPRLSRKIWCTYGIIPFLNLIRCHRRFLLFLLIHIVIHVDERLS